MFERSASVSAPPQTWSERVAYRALWLCVFSFPMEKAIMIPGVGSIGKAMGGAALAVGLLAVVIDGRVRTPSRALGLLAAFAFWNMLSYRWSLDPGNTLDHAFTCLQLLGVAWLIWQFCASEWHLEGLMRAYVFGTFYACFDTIRNYLVGAQQIYYQRYASAGFDPNDLALTLALSIPLSYCLAIRTPGWRSLTYYLQVGITYITILLSASRSGFVVGCLAGLIAVLTLPRVHRMRRVAVVAAILAAAVAAIFFVPATSFNRLATIGSEVSSGSLNSRSMIWAYGLESFRDHPLLGVGGSGFPRSVEPSMGWGQGWVIVAHNTFLSVLVETGVIGFAMFAGVLAMLLAAVWRMRGLQRLMWGHVMVVWIVGVSTLTWEVRKPTWLVFALIMVENRFYQPQRLARAWSLLPRPRTQEVALP